VGGIGIAARLPGDHAKTEDR